MGLIVGNTTLNNGLTVANTYIGFHNLTSKVYTTKIQPEDVVGNCTFKIESNYCMYLNQLSRNNSMNEIYVGKVVSNLTATEFETKNSYQHLYDVLKVRYPDSANA